MGAISPELEACLGAGTVVLWQDLPETTRDRLQDAIAPGQNPECVVYPETVEALGQVMKFAHARGIGVLPMGSGSKLHWGGIVENAKLVVGTTRLNRIVEHAVGDLTLTVEAGTKLRVVEEILAKSRQFLAIDPSYAEDATLGGITATADMGSWRQRYNSIRDRLIGISFVRSDGELVKAGGRVVKNVAGYDLMKLLTGSYGTLGIIAQLTFRLYPLPEDSETVVLTGDAEPIAQAQKTLMASSLAPAAMDVLSPEFVRQLDLGDGFGLCVQFQNVAPSVRQQCDRLLELGNTLQLNAVALRNDEGNAETDLWQRSQKLIESGDPQSRLFVKLGVRPSETVAALQQIETLFNQKDGEQAIARCHSGSGLGQLRIPRQLATTAYLLQLRRHCQAAAGFLTLIEAPQSLKRQIDIWGYTGNAKPAMERIKQQFDPQNQLSPQRFMV